MMKATSLLILALLSLGSFCYLQLSLIRNEIREGLKNGPVNCITKQIDKSLDQQKKTKKEEKKQKKKAKKTDDEDEDEDEDNQQDDEDEDEQQSIDDDKIQAEKNYRQICYEKDISYSLPIYLNDKLSMISLDTTVPISWFKGSNCHLEASSKKCSSVTVNMKDKISKIFKKKQQKAHHNQNDYAIIEGSSELVKGIQQTGKDFSFVTRDSSRLTNLVELLLLGFYMKGEKDTVALQATNFINATEISQNLNYLCDGAISMRFDELSECSFLKELIDYQKIQDKFVSVYIDRYGSGIVTVGEAASKYSKNGFGGLQWMDIKIDNSYGKLPVITDIIIENQGSHVFSEIREKQYPAVISLSASYIGIPKQLMSEWLQKFNKKSDCAVNEVTKYLECKSFKQKQERKIITFGFEGKKISFELSELIMGKQKGKTIFNMKQTLHENYAVLGEPLFKKYLIVFDYNKDKVGFGQKAEPSQKQFINVVSLVRFICFVFVFGCSFILCFLPIKRCFQLVKSKAKYDNGQSKGQTRRLKQYSPIQENPYQDLSGKVKQVFGSSQI